MYIDRYPAPNAEALWSRQMVIQGWYQISLEYAKARIAEVHMSQELPPPDQMRGLDDIGEALMTELNSIKCPTAIAVRTREGATGHEVTAFLQLLTEQMTGELKRHIHYGLTSQDLIDWSLFQACRIHAKQLSRSVRELRRVLVPEHEFAEIGQQRAGRTHGQIAARTSWQYQRLVIRDCLEDVQNALNRYADQTVIKSPGPVGTNRFTAMRGFTVAHRLGGQPVASTQVIPRDYLLRWAALYLRLSVQMENLALQIRLGARSDVGEFSEGARRDGSSAMPHKSNPIDSEKVCGLARIARGQFSALAEGVALWEDRDLTNSSEERVAVPLLAQVVEHQVDTMEKVMKNLVVHTFRMAENAADPRGCTDVMQMLLQKHFPVGPIEASNLVKSVVNDTKVPKNVRAWCTELRVVMEDEYTEEQANRWFGDVLEYWED